MADVNAIIRLIETLAAKRGSGVKAGRLEHKSASVPPLAAQDFEQTGQHLSARPGTSNVTVDERNIGRLQLDDVDALLARIDAVLAEQPVGSQSPLIAQPKARTISGQGFDVAEAGPIEDVLMKRLMGNVGQDEGAKQKILQGTSSTNFGQLRNIIEQQLMRGNVSGEKLDFIPSDVIQDVFDQTAKRPIQQFQTTGPGSRGFRQSEVNPQLSEMLRRSIEHGPTTQLNDLVNDPVNMRIAQRFGGLDPALSKVLANVDETRGVENKSGDLAKPFVVKRKFDEKSNKITDREGIDETADAEIEARSRPVSTKEIVKSRRKKSQTGTTQELEQALLGADLSPVPVQKLPEGPRVDPLAKQQAPVMRESSDPKIDAQRERLNVAVQALKLHQAGKLAGGAKSDRRTLERGEDVEMPPSGPEKLRAPESMTAEQRRQFNRDRITRKMLEREQQDQPELGF